jgi:hypothetical protein
VDPPLHRGNVPRDGFEIGFDSRPGSDRQLGDAQQSLGIVPGRQVAQRVLAHQEEESRWAESLGEDLERVGRV